jgi:ATP-dependent Clp protease ATP-binding subunit ClpA
MYEKMCEATEQKGADKTELSDDIRKVVKCAYEQSREWGHEYIGAEHLLIAILLAGEGSGYKILNNLGITPEKVREETQRLIVCRDVENERKEK